MWKGRSWPLTSAGVPISQNLRTWLTTAETDRPPASSPSLSFLLVHSPTTTATATFTSSTTTYNNLSLQCSRHSLNIKSKCVSPVRHPFLHSWNCVGHVYKGNTTCHRHSHPWYSCRDLVKGNLNSMLLSLHELWTPFYFLLISCLVWHSISLRIFTRWKCQLHQTLNSNLRRLIVANKMLNISGSVTCKGGSLTIRLSQCRGKWNIEISWATSGFTQCMTDNTQSLIIFIVLQKVHQVVESRNAYFLSAVFLL